MKRGELWTVSGGSAYTGKPRPALVIQDDLFDDLDSIVVCPLTSNPAEFTIARPVLRPNDGNGLIQPSRVMIDKIAALPKPRFGKLIGQVDQKDLERINRSLIVFLGIAGTIMTPIEDS